MAGLASQNVCEVRHIKMNKDGHKVATGTLVLTFDSTTLSREIPVEYLNVPVEIHIPHPMRSAIVIATIVTTANTKAPVPNVVKQFIIVVKWPFG